MIFNKSTVILGCIFTFLCLSSPIYSASIESNPETTAIPLALPDLLFEVSKRNSAILSQELQWQITEQQQKSKEAIFEPIFYGNYTHSEINQPNTTQEQTYRLNQANYREKTQNYEGGLKGLLPTGASYRVGFSSVERQSNLIKLQRPYRTEYNDIFTINLTQPLLRDMGIDVTLTQANIAKANQDIAFYTYRQQLIENTGAAAQYYWRLFGMQQIYKGWQDSLTIAQDLLENSQYQAKSGRVADTDVLKAESAVKLRQAKLTDAESDIRDTEANLLNILNISVNENPHLRLMIDLNLDVVEKVKIPEFDDSFKTALEKWPPYLINKKKIELEDIQVNYAENQTLPRLDLVAGNLHNALTADRSQTYSQTYSGNNISWNAGVQLEVPIFGNEKAEADLKAATLRRRQAEIELEPVKRQFSNNLYAKINRLKNAQVSFALTKKAYQIEEKLLATELKRWEIGKSSNDDVLKQEENTLNQKRNYLSSLVELKVAETLVDITNGSLFDKYNIHIAKSDGDVILTKDSLNDTSIHSKK